MERRVAIYSGRVQGVGFRATVRALAEGYRVTGWVRNEPDGRVRLEAQGEPSEIDALLDAVAGRLQRFISGRDVRPTSPVPDESEFGIRY